MRSIALPHDPALAVAESRAVAEHPDPGDIPLVREDWSDASCVLTLAAAVLEGEEAVAVADKAMERLVRALRDDESHRNLVAVNPDLATLADRERFRALVDDDGP